MSTQTSSLIISLIDRLSAPARGVNAAISGMSDAVRRNAVQMDAARGRMLDAAAAGYALAKAISTPVRDAMNFESAMADIKKVVDFDTPAGFKALGKDIRRMAITDIPMAADGLAAIVAAAGQSGIAVDELTGFADMAAKVSVAWETSAGETGEALAKLKTALGLSVSEVGLMADAINHLGNNTAASAPDILAFTRRVAPMAKQFGLSTEQAAAFGAAMVGSGFESQVAATSFLNMGRALTKGASATARQQKAMKAIGVNSRKVSEAMQKDAVGTIQTILAQINKLPDHRRASVISDIFGDEAKALGPLINDAGLLAKVLGLVAKQTEYAGSAQKEFEERSKTTEAALQLFKNRLTDLSISVGAALLPTINSLIGAFSPLVNSLSDLAQRYPNVTTAIVATTAAIVGFRVATTAASFAALFMKGSLLQMGLVGLKGIGGAMSGASTAVGALGAALGLGGNSARRLAKESVAGAQAMVLQTQAAYRSAQTLLSLAGSGQIAGLSVKQASANLAAAGRAAVDAQAGLKSANAALAGTSRTAAVAAGAMKVLKVALISTGIGAAAVAIGAAGAWIYNNWQGITTAFEAFKGAFARAIEPVQPMLAPVIDGISSLVGWVSNLLGPVDEMGGSWASAGIAAGKFVGDVVVAIVGLPGKIKAMAGDMMSAGSELMSKLMAGIVEGMAKIVEHIRSSFSSAFSAAGKMARNVLSTVTFGLVGGGGDAAAPVVDGARARGGPVRRGGTYLVGEEGPELFSPGRSGMISPNDIYQEISRGGVSPQKPSSGGMGDVSISISVPGVIVRAEADIDKLVREIGRRLREEVRGLQGDINYAIGV